MDRYQQMRMFVAVAEMQGFSAAARRLSVSAPVVTRTVAALEKDLGVKLLERTTRSVQLTDAGRGYLEDARRILAEIEAADAAAIGEHTTPAGRLRITAPALFGRQYVTPCVIEYLKRYPGTEVSAMFIDRNINLIEEGIDVSIRIGELPDSGLQARRVGAVRQVLCASPAYLEQHGKPKTPQDISDHELIISRAVGGTSQWRFYQNGKPEAVRLRPRLVVNTNDSAIEAARQGFGITRVLSYQINAFVVSGELDILLPNYEPEPLPVHVLHHEGRHSRAKVRSFLDIVVDRLKAELGSGP